MFKESNNSEINSQIYGSQKLTSNNKTFFFSIHIIDTSILHTESIFSL